MKEKMTEHRIIWTAEDVIYNAECMNENIIWDERFGILVKNEIKAYISYLKEKRLGLR